MSEKRTDPTFIIVPVSDSPEQNGPVLLAAENLHRSLRPNLPDNYASYMRKMFSEGARMVVLMVEGKVKSIAVYRSFHTTFHEHRFYIDDLVTDAAERSHGYGHHILAWCEGEARKRGCKMLALDSGLQRAEAHRFYFRERLSIFAFNFVKPLN